MAAKLFVGNVDYETSERELRDAFAAHVEVASVTVVKDRQRHRPKGFAFVELADGADADAAIEALDGQPLGPNDRRLRVEVAISKGERGGGGNSRGKLY